MEWQITPSESTIEFSVRRWPGHRVRGQFEQFSGTAHYAPGKPQKNSVQLTLQVASLRAEPDRLTRALLDRRRLNARSYPTIRFKSTHVEQLDEQQVRITGYLTLRNITRRIQFDATFADLQQTADGAFQTTCHGRFTLRRSEWNLTHGWRTRLGLAGRHITVEATLALMQRDAPIAVDLPLSNSAAAPNAPAANDISAADLSAADTTS